MGGICPQHVKVCVMLLFNGGHRTHVRSKQRVEIFSRIHVNDNYTWKCINAEIEVHSMCFKVLKSSGAEFIRLFQGF